MLTNISFILTLSWVAQGVFNLRQFYHKFRSKIRIACVASVPIRERKTQKSIVIGERTSSRLGTSFGESAKIEARGRGKGEGERLHPSIMNLKYSVHQPTEKSRPLIGSKLDRWLKEASRSRGFTLVWSLTISRWRMTRKIYRGLSNSWPRSRGFDRELKEEQKFAILQLMRGGDLLVVLPTGFSKSLIF